MFLEIVVKRKFLTIKETNYGHPNSNKRKQRHPLNLRWCKPWYGGVGGGGGGGDGGGRDPEVVSCRRQLD